MDDRIYDDVLDLVGKTPLVLRNQTVGSRSVRITQTSEVQDGAVWSMERLRLFEAAGGAVDR